MKYKNIARYDFEKPIVITRYKSGGLDIMFYALLLSLCVAGIFILICWHDGQFKVDFVLWRVLLSFPLLLLTLLLKSLLNEIKTYTPKLLAKSTWTIEELMEMTGKDRKETERIITGVLETGFVVEASCLKNV